MQFSFFISLKQALFEPNQYLQQCSKMMYKTQDIARLQYHTMLLDIKNNNNNKKKSWSFGWELGGKTPTFPLSDSNEITD